ncbi:MAG: T9SS type A sorting domain-containing protein [Saprospiraceae bacterium]|nr:T9SS type A sorting domain-containing protein [Saprospiraceae bacterium]
MALHEIGHGLGFTGSARIDSLGNGLLGYDFPLIYDVFVDDNAGDPITDLTSPSAELYAAYTAGTGSLFFDDSNLNYFRSPEQTMELHTPPTFTLGSSVSHFSEENLGDELMSPIFYNGQAIHTPNLAEIVLKEIGWNFIALPIQLLSFVVNEMEDGHFLEWKTDYEYNNDHFDIERSLDGTSFELVGEVPAIEERTSIKSYAFLDTKAPQELSYYRLKQVDIDGSFSYSDTKTAFRKEKFAAWQLGPNPATEALELILPEQLKSYSLSFFDASGALQMTINGHENRQKIDISGLSPGIKYARLSDENGVIGWKNFLVVRP